MPGPLDRLESSLNPQLRQVFQNQVVGVTGSYFSSTIIDVPPEHKEFALLVATISTGNPTSLQMDVQFTFDSGINWFGPGVSDWESLSFSTTGTSKKWLTGGRVAGSKARVRAIGIGTSDGSNFEVSAWLRTT